MNGVGLTTVGRPLGHRQRETTAIYAHLDDGALRDAAAQAAAVVARAMGYKVEPPQVPDDAEHRDVLAATPEFSRPRQRRSDLLFGSDLRTPRGQMTPSRKAMSGRPSDAQPWTGCDGTPDILTDCAFRRGKSGGSSMAGDCPTVAFSAKLAKTGTTTNGEVHADPERQGRKVRLRAEIGRASCRERV